MTARTGSTASVRASVHRLVSTAVGARERKYQPRDSWWCSVALPGQREQFVAAAHQRADERGWSSLMPFAPHARD